MQTEKDLKFHTIQIRNPRERQAHLVCFTDRPIILKSVDAAILGEPIEILWALINSGPLDRVRCLVKSRTKPLSKKITEAFMTHHEIPMGSLLEIDIIKVHRKKELPASPSLWHRLLVRMGFGKLDPMPDELFLVKIGYEEKE